MKSRITIEIDFMDSNEPILVIQKEWSEDIRDKIVYNFIERLGSSSSYFKLDRVEPVEHISGAAVRYVIKPITPQELETEGSNMIGISPSYNTQLDIFNEHGEVSMKYD